MNREIKADIRNAVALAVHYWPNARLGDFSPREDIRSAFRMIRNGLRDGLHIQSAIGAVEADAYRHADM